ncbi:unnamed protein product, partial [Ixodes persulcatus]
MGALRSRAAPGFLPLLLLAVLMGSRVSAKNGVDLFVSSTLRTWANMSRMVVDKDTGKNDPNYHSYTEVELVCRSDKDADYNLAQAGFVSKPGSDLAGSLGYDDDVLFVVFAKSENETNDRPGNESALCLFPLEA